MGDVSRTKTRSKSTADVWGGQSPYLLDLYRRGQEMLDGFQPNTSVTDPAMQAWQNQLNPQGNPYLQQMTSQYSQALGQLDQRTGMQAAAGGVYGGGRQGVEQHLNQQNIGNQMGNFMGAQYQADMNRAQGALGMAPQMLGMTPYGQQQQALAQYGNLIGRPTVLGQSSSSGSGFGLGIGAK